MEVDIWRMKPDALQWWPVTGGKFLPEEKLLTFHFHPEDLTSSCSWYRWSTSSEIMLFFRENAIMSRSSVPSCGYSWKSISIAFKRPGLSTNSILGPTWNQQKISKIKMRNFLHLSPCDHQFSEKRKNNIIYMVYRKQQAQKSNGTIIKNISNKEKGLFSESFFLYIFLVTFSSWNEQLFIYRWTEFQISIRWCSTLVHTQVFHFFSAVPGIVLR